MRKSKYFLLTAIQRAADGGNAAGQSEEEWTSEGNPKERSRCAGEENSVNKESTWLCA